MLPQFGNLRWALQPPRGCPAGDSIPTAVERGHSAPEYIRSTGYRSFIH